MNIKNKKDEHCDNIVTRLAKIMNVRGYIEEAEPSPTIGRVADAQPIMSRTLNATRLLE